MKVLVDTNVLISAARDPRGVPYRAFIKATTHPNTGYLTDQNIEELRRVFQRKWPKEIEILNHFLALMSGIRTIPTPAVESGKELLIRDIADRPILRAALAADIDVILTGDKDFLESEVVRPQMLAPAQFLRQNDISSKLKKGERSIAEGNTIEGFSSLKKIRDKHDL